MVREIKTENIIGLVSILVEELKKRGVDYLVNYNHSSQDRLDYIQKFLSKDEILSTYDSTRYETNTFYYEIIEENKQYKRFASDLESIHDEYEITKEYIKYYPNLNLYIKIIYTENSDGNYMLVQPTLKLKVEYE